MNSAAEQTVRSKMWCGTSITDICKGKGCWSFAVSPVTPSKYHCILYKLPVNLRFPPKCHYSSERRLWDNEHVRMPFSEENLFPVHENGNDVIKQRWLIIQTVLSSSITSTWDFEYTLNKYNSALPKFDLLHYFFNEAMTKEDSEQFFTNLLPKIIELALKLPKLLPCGIPLLRQNHNRSLSLSQLQISCLLANAFLCTFPWKKNVAATYPGINFDGLFSAFDRPKRKQCVCEKLKCLFNYFKRVTDQTPVGVVTFERKIIPKASMPKWDTIQKNLGNTRVHISSSGTIEDGLGFLQVDFANKNIGGGVLRYGCVQEEIRFVICPELIISRLFVEQLGNGEALIITGAERYNNYTGYGDTFKWHSNCEDKTPFDIYGRKRTTICAIDALKFSRPPEQFQRSMILRELNKAYVGFSSREKDGLAPVATGNWGCGAFKGSKQLKTLIQLIACTVAGRDLVYYSFEDVELMENFYKIYLFLANNHITVQHLWNFLGKFRERSLNEDKLYSFVQQAYFDSKKQPSISKYFFKQNESKKESLSDAVPSTSSKKWKSSPVEVTFSKKMKIDEAAMVSSDETSSSLEDVIPASPPEERQFVKLVNMKRKRDMTDVEEQLPETDISAIFDRLDGNANQAEAVTENLGDLDDSNFLFDKFSIHDEKMDVDEGSHHNNAAPRKKITDYFNKTNK